MLVSSVMCCAMSVMTCCNQAQGFDLPGLAPVVYCEEGQTTETCKLNNQIKWSSRWDYILESVPHTNIQWFRFLFGVYFLLNLVLRKERSTAKRFPTLTALLSLWFGISVLLTLSAAYFGFNKSLLNIQDEPIRYPDRYLPNHFTLNQSLVF